MNELSQISFESVKADYTQKGFVCIENVFSDSDVEHWRIECERLRALFDSNTTDSRVHWRDNAQLGRIPDRLDPVEDISEEFSALSNDPRIEGIVRGLLGGDIIRLKSKLILKQPGTNGYDLHQDYPYWDFLGIPADEMLVSVVPIDVWSRQSGAVEFFPGLHGGRINGPADSPLDTDPALVDMSSGVIMSLEPGDLGIFHPLAPHQSGPNTSHDARRTLYFTYTRSNYRGICEQYYSVRPEYEAHKK